MKVTLAKPHTHDGTEYAKGEQIEVSDAQAAWLADLKVIEPLPGKNASNTGTSA